MKTDLPQTGPKTAVPHPTEHSWTVSQAAMRSAQEIAPTFLFGMERSGTTLLAMMMGAHPQIAVPLSTTGMWYDFFARVQRDYHGLTDDEAITRLVDDVLVHERIRLWNTELERERILANCQPGDFGSVVAAVHHEYARQRSKPHWANSDIATLDAMHLANGWFPNGRFLHIIRDARDVALSHQTMPFGAGNIAECALAWRHRVGQSLRMGAILGPNRYLAIRYEDLILESESTLRHICGFLGVPFSPVMLDYGVAVEQTIPEHKLWLWPEIKKPPQRSKVEIWKNRMSAAQRTVCEWNAGDLLRELGYETFATPPRQLPAYLLELWYFIGRGHRWNRLKGKLGLAGKSRLEKQASRREGTTNAERQRTSFNCLIDDGTYSADFDHPTRMKQFVATVLQEYLLPGIERPCIRLLDCGCGTGAWLQFQCTILQQAGHEVRAMGFDLSERMVATAREVLGDTVKRTDLRQGDLLSPAAFAFAGCDDGFDLIFAYDLIQQLPPARQSEACRRIASHLACDGIAVVFDHDSDSPYGRSMHRKKLLRRYLGIPLVPAYYCNARYPRLARIAHMLNQATDLRTEVAAAPDGRKRALIIRRVAPQRA